MATAASRDIKDFVFEWEGKDRHGKIVRGEVRASGENQVQATLRRQKDKAQRHRFVHASACHNDESRRSTSAIV